MSKNQNQRVNEIEKIYLEYLEKLRELKKEQNKVINKFTTDLESEKVDELRKKLE